MGKSAAVGLSDIVTLDIVSLSPCHSLSLTCLIRHSKLKFSFWGLELLSMSCSLWAKIACTVAWVKPLSSCFWSRAGAATAFGALLVFQRKDLCEARFKPEMSSYFQMKCPDKMYPHSCQMKWTRWSAHGHQIWVHIFRWSVQISCQIYPPGICQMKCTRWNAHRHQIWVHIFRWSVQIQIYPPVQNCQWQQINYCLIYVFNESPFETVTELGQVFRLSVQLGQLVRWSAQWDQIYPPGSDILWQRAE